MRRHSLQAYKTIPGSYATRAAAITNLNAQGVGAGGVTFNVVAGYTETAANLLITAGLRKQKQEFRA